MGVPPKIVLGLEASLATERERNAALTAEARELRNRIREMECEWENEVNAARAEVERLTAEVERLRRQYGLDFGPCPSCAKGVHDCQWVPCDCTGCVLDGSPDLTPEEA